MLLNQSITQLASGLRKKTFSSVDLIHEAFNSIEKINPAVNAFITVEDKIKAIDQAKVKDAALSQAKTLLHGIPFVLKDSYITRGIRTTAASSVLGNYIPQYDATVYKKLKEAGAILMGKMNMDAWGHGGSTENTDFGPAHNPWDTSRVAGGS